MRNPTDEERANLNDILHRMADLDHEAVGEINKLRRLCDAPPGAQLDTTNGVWIVMAQPPAGRMEP